MKRFLFAMFCLLLIPAVHTHLFYRSPGFPGNDNNIVFTEKTGAVNQSSSNFSARKRGYILTGLKKVKALIRAIGSIQLIAEVINTGVCKAASTDNNQTVTAKILSHKFY